MISCLILCKSNICHVCCSERWVIGGCAELPRLENLAQAYKKFGYFRYSVFIVGTITGTPNARPSRSLVLGKDSHNALTPTPV
ncbi:hypothetical protein TB2_039349 [Malus domestica]